MRFWPYTRYELISKLSSEQLKKKFELDSRLHGLERSADIKQGIHK